MEERDLISVIVPVYRVEKYLDECVASIVKQTYRNIEIILVDDGSPDNCPKMCDEWAKKDDRIKVIHKANGGVSSARNAGIEQAQGKYICFVDSDDYILDNYCEVMLAKMEQYNTDIVICGLITKGKPEYVIDNDIKIEFSKKEDFVKLYRNFPFLSPTNKLYKKDLIKIPFSIGVKDGEDELFNLNYCKGIKEAIVIPESLYYYRDNPESVTHGDSVKSLFSWIKNTRGRYELMREIMKDDRLAGYCTTYKVIYYIQKCVNDMQTRHLKSNDILNTIKSILDNDDVQYALTIYQYGFSKNNDHFCNLLKKRKYKRVCRFVKLKYFLRKLLKK